MSKIDLRFWKLGEVLGDPTKNSVVQIATKGDLKIAAKILSKFSHKKRIDRVGLLEMNNPNLVSIRDVVIRQKLRYNSEPITAILMEYCSDGDLENYISELGERDETFPPNLFIKWTRQMGEGILFLHSKNIIHGDLKTKNIFLTNGKEQAKIGDFDDRFILKEGKVDEPKGTEGWQAPETVTGGWTHKADVYSFALIIWSIFTLKNPENTYDLDEEIKNTSSESMNLFLSEYASENLETRKTIADFLREFASFEAMINESFSIRKSKANTHSIIDPSGVTDLES